MTQAADSDDRRWALYLGVVVAASALAFALFPVDRPEHRWLALAELAAMVLWYLVLGRRAVADVRESWRGWLFQAVLFALFVAALATVGTASLLVAALCPLAYETVRLSRAHAVVAAYGFAPALVSLAHTGPRALLFNLPLGVIVTTLSVVVAVTGLRRERISQERAALIVELESSRAEIARLSHEAGIAQERQRLAGEIHDTVAQGLSSVVMLVEAADAALGLDPERAREHLRLAARSARENLAETRAIVAALTPAQLNGAALADALRRLVDRFTEETGTVASLSTVGDRRPLPTRAEVVLLRVVQEALHNARKHSAATTVEVELDIGPEAAAVRVRDDGVGFDPEAPDPGYGLPAMRARVEQIGGTLMVTTGPGQGTTIRTEVPT